MPDKIIYRNKMLHVNDNTIDPISGSTFWSLSGSNVQFTGFDVPAKTNFPVHKHSSEQITYVLEGDLFFKTHGAIYKLSAGDCIYIPGNIEHEVWTGDMPVKAVDAWSPVNKAYSPQSINK